MSDAAIRELLEFARVIGFPALFALILLYLFHVQQRLQEGQQDISSQQTQILGGLGVHVTEVAERTESHTQKLDRIHEMLERGVCHQKKAHD